MKHPPRIALVLVCGVLAAALTACDARAETADAPGKPFTQSIKDSYHELKNSVTQAFGGYTGNTSEDSETYMKQYQEDLDHYHNSIRDARDEYRRARLSEQKSYLEHHRSLPMNEDIDADVTQSSW